MAVLRGGFCLDCGGSLAGLGVRSKRCRDCLPAFKRSYWTARARAKEQALPRVAYRFMEPDGRLAYVGSGAASRPGAHRHKSPWWRPDLGLVVRVVPSTAHARRLEWDWFIRFGPPLYNVDGIDR